MANLLDFKKVDYRIKVHLFIFVSLLTFYFLCLFAGNIKATTNVENVNPTIQKETPDTLLSPIRRNGQHASSANVGMDVYYGGNLCAWNINQTFHARV
ncbi:MAG: hypothetical protein JW841_14960 [Deltaproteobacteria bacterium]|nr:hypothetical protein [Deltaproteobacteria bacterium]